jgi:prepilin-type processing-associated H-X9-DG protein
MVGGPRKPGRRDSQPIAARPRSRRRRRGYTIVELLLACVILVILFALLIPAVVQFREAARRASCCNNLRQLGVAIGGYHDAFEMFPPGSTVGLEPGPGGGRSRWHGWSVHARLLPWMDESVGYTALNLSQSVDAPGNRTGTHRVISLFLCPSDRNAGAPIGPGIVASAPGWTGPTARTNYAWNMGDWYVWGGFTPPLHRTPARGLFGPNGSVRREHITDGTVHTLMAGSVTGTDDVQVGPVGNLGSPIAPDVETLKQGLLATAALKRFGDPHTRWADGSVPQTGFTTALLIGGGPQFISRDERSPNPGALFAAISASSDHPGGVNVMLADGSVTYLSESMQPTIWRLLGSINDGRITEPGGRY